MIDLRHVGDLRQVRGLQRLVGEGAESAATGQLTIDPLLSDLRHHIRHHMTRY